MEVVIIPTLRAVTVRAELGADSGRNVANAPSQIGRAAAAVHYNHLMRREIRRSLPIPGMFFAYGIQLSIQRSMSSTPPPHSENPYATPQATGSSRAEASSVDVFTASGAFEVGNEERHDVRVTWSLWSGEEVYVVDNVEVMRLRKHGLWGARTLEVGEREKHLVEIRFRALPFTVVEVYIDGKRRIRNLFPRLGLTLWTMAAAGAIPLGLTIAWFLNTRG
jgi:hypothetical protein